MVWLLEPRISLGVRRAFLDYFRAVPPPSRWIDIVVLCDLDECRWLTGSVKPRELRANQTWYSITVVTDRLATLKPTKEGEYVIRVRVVAAFQRIGVDLFCERDGVLSR